MKFFRFYGSKTHLLNDIYKVISNVKDKITCFVDVFGGSGVVALNLPWKFNVIVYNDLDDYLYSTFKVIQDDEKRKKLLEKLEMAFRHRKVFEEYKEQYWESVENDEITKAFITIYLAQISFNGGFESYKTAIKTNRDFLNQAITPIKNFGKMLRNWIIENLDFREVIKKYDSKTTFFYLDPPYLTAGVNYKFGNWGIDDFKEMKELLDECKGFWLLNESEVDFDETIKIFGEPKFVKEYVNQNLNRKSIEKFGGRTKRKEGFWCNFPITKQSTFHSFLRGCSE